MSPRPHAEATQPTTTVDARAPARRSSPTKQDAGAVDSLHRTPQQRSSTNENLTTFEAHVVRPTLTTVSS
ncbi:MAG: hypothetical protein JNM69_07945 [Archangium sp.]|nr:hypothetical protein [Archangium sp.]